MFKSRRKSPPGFLCLGIKSKTIRKTADKENSYTQRDYILREDLHGLFGNNLNENTTKPRRSSRILRQVEEAQNLDGLSASDYYSRVLTQDSNTTNSKRGEGDFYKNKSALKNNSKSLFRKINERCARAAAQNAISFNYAVRPILGENVKVEVFKATSFCKNLSEEIRIDLKQSDALLDCKLAVSKKTQKINDILCGKRTSEMEVSESSQNGKLDVDQNDQEEERKYFDYIPSCDWIYETPPRQRITLPKLDECAIQPAVICTTKKKSNIYELNPNINVDLTNYTNRQNVEVDGKYLKHLASFEDKTQADFGMDFLESRGDQNWVVNESGYFQNPMEHSDIKVSICFDCVYMF
ncbi:hypothetical protein NQ314_012942 [Rhamnusium bicolor]|uniref:Uncharacterized protein n=1 Tax=Rhamnusium bicolor TaxID=1586634 RepID=A0AAV8X9U8_9CUCU|nr:hypothetical protein NQ314_012942 [Rhamnusium bicolor]